MSILSSHARAIGDLLLATLTRVREMGALVLADRGGLPLVSTMPSGKLEECLAAFSGLATSAARFARDEMAMGSWQVLHLAGRDHQYFVLPVTGDAVLAAITDSDADTATIERHMLALAVEILTLVVGDPDEGSPLSIRHSPESTRESSLM